MSAVRIGKVRLKASGLVVHMHTDHRSVEIRTALVEHAGTIATLFPVHGPDRLGGFAIVAWGIDGSWSRATRIHPRAMVGPTTMPAIVADVLRRDTMRDVTLETLGLDPNPPNAG